MNPGRNLVRGLRAFWDGVFWLKGHTRFFILLFVPWMIGLILMVTAFSFFIRYDETILNWLLFEPGQAWWSLLLYYLALVFVYFGVIVFTLISGLLIANVLAAPVYEIVSVAIEKDLRHGHVEEVSFWRSLRLIPEELKKVFAILGISLLLLMIPGLNVFAIFVTAFLVGWDFYDYPLARRGWSFKQRIDFVKGDVWAVMGLGLWLVIPFVQFILMPLAVAGGTMLNLDRLQLVSNQRDRSIGSQKG